MLISLNAPETVAGFFIFRLNLAAPYPAASHRASVDPDKIPAFSPGQNYNELALCVPYGIERPPHTRLAQAFHSSGDMHKIARISALQNYNELASCVQ